MTKNSVDVLAVLRHHESQINEARRVIGRNLGMNPEAICDALNEAVKGMREARAALAKLIEATNRLRHAVGELDLPKEVAIKQLDAVAAIAMAMVETEAALARVGAA